MTAASLSSTSVGLTQTGQSMNERCKHVNRHNIVTKATLCVCAYVSIASTCGEVSIASTAGFQDHHTMYL